MVSWLRTTALLQIIFSPQMSKQAHIQTGREN